MFFYYNYILKSAVYHQIYGDSGAGIKLCGACKIEVWQNLHTLK